MAGKQLFIWNSLPVLNAAKLYQIQRCQISQFAFHCAINSQADGDNLAACIVCSESLFRIDMSIST